LVTPQFKISPNLMVYSRIASGYRPGRANGFSLDPAVPFASRPDKTKNYEIGLKGDVLDHALSFDASLYHIDFNDIQITLIDSLGNTYFDNGGDAKSEGVEISVEHRLPKGLTVAGWATYDNAVLTSNFPANSAAVGLSGNKLPYSSRVSGNISINQDVAVTTSIIGFARVELSYVGDRSGPFSGTPERQDFPAYTKVDLRAGAKTGQWRFNIYVNNATDRRGLIGGGRGNIPPQAFLYIKPRTVGMSVVRTF
jgi:outer membrane receptor protein involved in Fe transport